MSTHATNHMNINPLPGERTEPGKASNIMNDLPTNLSNPSPTKALYNPEVVSPSGAAKDEICRENRRQSERLRQVETENMQNGVRCAFPLIVNPNTIDHQGLAIRHILRKSSKWNL